MEGEIAFQKGGPRGRVQQRQKQPPRLEQKPRVRPAVGVRVRGSGLKRQAEVFGPKWAAASPRRLQAT